MNNISGLNSNKLDYDDIFKYKNIETKKAYFLGNNIENKEADNLDGLPEGNDFESKLKRAMEQKDEIALKEVCQNLEEIFLQMMYKQMKATVPKSDLVSESSGRQIFDSMLEESLMKEASKANGIGLADMMYKQLYREMNNAYKKNIVQESRNIK